MYLSASSQGWFNAIGGWPNLLQGLLSAAITGAVAALVSFAVVNRTNVAARKLAIREEARKKLIEAVEVTIDTFLGVPNSRPWRQDFEEMGALSFKLRLAAALMAQQDIKIAHRVQGIADQLAAVANNWKEQPSLQQDSQASKRYDDAWAVVSPLHEDVINWLGNIKPIYRDRNQDNAHTPSA
jgi:hypothetical protein